MALLNLVDPISHDLLVNLARDLQCPKKVRSVGISLGNLASHACLGLRLVTITLQEQLQEQV